MALKRSQFTLVIEVCSLKEESLTFLPCNTLLVQYVLWACVPDMIHHNPSLAVLKCLL